MVNWNKRVVLLLLVSISFLCIGLGLMAQIPYYTMNPGTAIDTGSVVKVSHGEEGTGNFYLTTVTLKEGNVFDYLHAKVAKEIQLIPASQVGGEGQSDEEYHQKMLADMQTSQNHAVVAAFQTAKRPVQVTHTGVEVLGIVKDNDKGLQVKDRIIAIDGVPTQSIQQLIQQLQTYQVGQPVKVKLYRKQRLLEEKVRLVSVHDNQVGLGIYPFDRLQVASNPKVEFKTENIGGPSAGLMFSLEILSQLVDEDITHGLEIAGTGEISKEGKVGQIGGIEQKVWVAHQQNMDIFFCPKDVNVHDKNEKQAKAMAKQIGTTMKIVPVSSLEEAMAYLQSFAN